MQKTARVNGTGNDWFTGGNDWFHGGNDWFTGGNDWLRGGNDWFVPTAAEDGNDW
ncbi:MULTISPECIES: DEAD/DEAH box helicase [Kribbella]|uniref:DEAD/DEAH box helicase n=1 Tax=Kribbella karoonensis TaxID=324851 RepID=A0ABP4NXQ7_9ACTN